MRTLRAVIVVAVVLAFAVGCSATSNTLAATSNTVAAGDSGAVGSRMSGASSLPSERDVALAAAGATGWELPVNIAGPTVEQGDSAWQFEIMPYLWAPASIDGDATVRGATVRVDAGLNDVLSGLTFAGSLRAEAWKGPFGFFLDSMFVDLGIDGDLPGPGGGVDVDLTKADLDLGAAYRVLDVPLSKEKHWPRLMLEPMGGARFVYLRHKVTVDPPGPGKVRLRDSQTWVEPFVGARAKLEMTDRLALMVRGDASGFGIGSGSDLTWNVVGGVAYRPWEHLTLKAGYRYYSIDYSHGSFALDAALHGPWLGASWRF